MLRILFIAYLMVGLVFGQWQEDSILQRRQGSLDTLESLGIQLLSSILSPSPASSTTSSSSATSLSTSASATSSSAAASSSSSAVASPRSSSSVSSVSAAAATTTPTPTALSNTNAENRRHRNIAIIVGSVLGAVVVLLALSLLVCCFLRRQRSRRAARGRQQEKLIDDDDDELDGVNHPAGAGGMAYVTRIESWHEPRTRSRNSSMGPPRGSQSRVSLVQRDVPPERYNKGPAAPVPVAVPPPERYNNGPAAPVPVPVPPPHRSSQYGLIQNGRESMYNEPKPAYFDQPHRRSMDDASRDSNKYPGYVPYRSTHSLVERSPTPLFGSDKTPGETQPQQSIKRKSVGSSHGGPTAVNSALSSKDPSPHNAGAGNGSGPFVPPRSRRRESMPGSPLQHEFEFGFENQNQEQSRRHSRPSRMPGGWSNGSIADAHHRFG